ncbi:hypothetical protein CAC42_2389 [Sphaceloma murrayae]|uniref:Uncharacterized protein n=1 Tax=Sphaceloma murrayae TaxID=2082308 RepID=A0A2K1QVX7_9PEZI|nr:hypothetical protein CAC42_2389 [Sphaceloma murrayae]
MAEGTSTGAPLLIRQADLKDAAKVGLFTGGTGFTIGATAGLFRDTSPTLFGLVSGIQCFGLGTTFWASRSAVLAAWYSDRNQATPRDRIYASTLAGGFTGLAMGLLTRGKSNAVPGGLMFSVFGASGQGLYNLIDASNSQKPAQDAESKGVLKWIARQKWSPFSILTDTEYERILRERILQLDVEIALIDDRIAALGEKSEPPATTANGNVSD